MRESALHIGIVGPVATENVAHLLDGPARLLPAGTRGAPLLATLIEELLRRGHRVSALTQSGAMPLTDDATQVARGHRFALHLCPTRPRAWPMNGRLPGRIVDLYAFERRQLQRALRSAAPDIVHAHWTYEYAWAALRSDLPLVVTCHDSPLLIARFQTDLKRGAYRWLRAGIAWHVLRHAPRVTAVSPYLAEQIQPLSCVPVTVVPNPVPGRAFETPRGTRHTGGAFRIVLAANGWDARKNVQAAFEAFALLQDRAANTELHAYGLEYGQGEPAHRWWLARGAPGRVRFHGAVSHDVLLQAMVASDALLHPSLEETFGAVLAEAMATGLPVVAGRKSGAVPWVVGDGGLLVDVTQPEAMAAALLRLTSDPAFAARLGQAGRQQSRQRFGVEAVANAYEGHYDIELSRRAPAQPIAPAAVVPSRR